VESSESPSGSVDRTLNTTDATPSEKADTGLDDAPKDLLRKAYAQASLVLGQAVSLFCRSPAHRHLLLSDLEWRLVPPIALRQFRLIFKKEMPYGFVSWALVSEDVERRLDRPDFRLRPADWSSGDRAWIIDVVAPPDQALGFIDAIKEKVLAEWEVKVRTLCTPMPVVGTNRASKGNSKSNGANLAS
jgi:hemolysin-activating ACP:hemolysin acyltransferase